MKSTLKEHGAGGIAGRDVPLYKRDKKADLVRFLSDKRIAQAVVDSTIVVSGGCSD